MKCFPTRFSAPPQVEGFVANPMFDPTAMQRTSKAAAALCKWVKAMDAYQKGQQVRPQGQTEML
jgi:hypothetical protein